MDEEAIAAVVKEIEEEQALNRVSAVQVFQSILNQPALLSISSASATAEGSGDGYTSFSVDMPRPILQVKELELLTANIPLCTQNIPDTACVFWYYRLSLYSGKNPNPNNLFFVRLLPSYYKPEFVRNFENFGYNKTFNGYPDVATQLALATTQDLAQVNFTDTDAGLPYYRIQYLNNDEVKLTYDSAINKFQFSGNNGLPIDERPYELIFNKYNSGTTYALGDIVVDTLFYVPGWGFACYESLSAGNTGNALPVYPSDSNAFWSRNYNVEGVAPYSATTAYRVGQFAERLNVLYRVTQNTFGNQPPNASFWEANPDVSSDLYRYIATGPLDPEVAFMQGTSQRTWSPYALYEEQDTVLYKGITYKASKQNLGTEPFPVPNATDNAYNAAKQYQVGDYVFYSTLYYVNIKASKGIAPPGGYTNNANWNFIEYDPNRPSNIGVPPATTFYQVGDIITYVGFANIPFFRCKKSFPPANSVNTAGNVRFGENEYWEATYWTTGTSPTEVPYVGLAKISADLDMMDDLFGVVQYPFPEGIPPQPFSLNPKRLLNSILGFTWNGKFTPSQFDQLYDAIILTGSTTITQLFNRLRPVPIYAALALSSPLTAGSVNLNPTITANGYAKLVYTSVVNIYASIAGGSTIDTIRNTNLIGTMAMNAGNLGIGFSAAYLNATLQTQDTDIYSISFSFTDEYGDPYPLTNNAVVTLTFRMGYKESKK
jgi:hypothetical protein